MTDSTPEKAMLLPGVSHSTNLWSIYHIMDHFSLCYAQNTSRVCPPLALAPRAIHKRVIGVIIIL